MTPLRTRPQRILDGVRAGGDLSVEDALVLVDAPLDLLCEHADALRAEQVGDAVTYVVNRNINFTNVCVLSCRFCAFSRDLRSERGYDLPDEEVVRRAVEARDYGATEVCVQAGLTPDRRGRRYADLTRAIKAAAPELHLHAFSPEEIRYGARLAKASIHDYLAELKAAGLDSLPGTSAEILDDRVRAQLAPGRLTTADWLEVVTTAHALGLPTTSTMMFGHIEDWADRIRHLALLRSVQRESGGFTEFVPLSFVHEEAPLFREQMLRDEGVVVPPGPGESERVRLYALARLMLGRDIPHLQASWVKEGLPLSTRLLRCGVDDLGGTLMNESISTSAGARHGQMVTPAALRAAIRSAGRVPVQRNTLYGALRRFEDPADDPADRLDEVDDADATFGSYGALAGDDRFRYRRLVRIE